MTEAQTEQKRVLLGEGLFTPTEPGEDGQIIATHCKSCGDYFFPRSFTCHNPECEERDVEDVALSPRGIVDTYSDTTRHRRRTWSRRRTGSPRRSSP